MTGLPLQRKKKVPALAVDNSIYILKSILYDSMLKDILTKFRNFYLKGLFGLWKFIS